MRKLIDFDNLKYYDKLLKQYIDLKLELLLHNKTNCPNCGAPIISTKCSYCGTDFEKMDIRSI